MPKRRFVRLSWWEARRKMAELCPVWYWPGGLGDEALVRAFQRGNIRHQHRGCSDCFGQEVPLEEVFKGLQRVTFLGSDRASVEFEITEVQQSFTAIGRGSLQMLSPLSFKSKRTVTVWIRCPELIWEDLYDHLTLWELDKGGGSSRKRRDERDGAEPDADPEGDSEDQDQECNYPSEEEWVQIIDGVIEENGVPAARGEKTAIVKAVDNRLAFRGLKAHISTIKRRINARLEKSRFGSLGS